MLAQTKFVGLAAGHRFAEATRAEGVPPAPARGETSPVNIHSVAYGGSVADGPGIRAVLYVQGCLRKCPGCHNPTTWDRAAGRTVEGRDLADEIRARVPNRRLTISGGEPLLQARPILELATLLDDFDLALYTGFDLADVQPELLARLTHVKVGAYEREKRCTDVPYVGSTNQRFLTLKPACR